MKSTFSIISLIIIIALEVNAQPLTDIRILSEDQHSVVLEFTPQIRAERVSGNHNAVFTRFRFFDSQIMFDSAGRANFYRVILLLVPSPRISLREITSEFEIRDSIKLIPKPTIKYLKDLGITEIYDDSKLSPSSSSTAHPALAELIRVGKTSIGYIGTFAIHPIQAVDNMKVRVYTRIIVRIDFQDALPAGILSSSLLKGNMPLKAPGESAMEVERKTYRNAVQKDFPFINGDWYRIEVQDAGMYKLDYNYFQSLNIQIDDINSVKLYGNRGLVIPDNNTDPKDSLVELPRLVVRKNSSGSPSSDDYIIFYGCGVTGWNYDGDQGVFHHYINPFSNKHYYFFSVNRGTGKQMGSTDASNDSTSILPQTSFQEKIFVEQELHNFINTGRRWAGRLLSSTNNIDTYYNTLSGLVPSSKIMYRFNFLHRSATSDILYIYENDELLQGSVSMGPTDMGDITTARYATEVAFTKTKTNGIPGETSTLKIMLDYGNQNSSVWLDWLEIFYQRNYTAMNEALLFTTPNVAGLARYAVSGFPSRDIRAFDITDHNNVKELKYHSSDPSICTFQLRDPLHKIAVVGINGLLTPLTTTKIEKATLHGFTGQVDFIIISPKEFLSEANRLKVHRESQPNRLSTLVVDIDQIYNEFSSDIHDPLAIREFLQYTQDNWTLPKPRYVLLFGWGHYDYKNIITDQNNWIPPYETEESLYPEDSYTSDDQFVIMNSTNSIALAIGRLPARNLKDATTVVNKIISYETNSFVDPWRNRITFVADDGKTSSSDEGELFTDDSEGIAENASITPKSFEKKKIYIVEYPTVNTGSGRRKPDVNRAIVDAINQGTLITNFIGHGNEQLWTHEAIFTQSGDLPQLHNSDRLTFVVASTCSYGRFDNPSILSSAEQLVTMEQGGAIADVSAARWVQENANIGLNTGFFINLLRSNSQGFLRLGDAWFLAKLSRMNDGNSRNFHLFGDPTLRLLMPKGLASVDSIDRKSTTATTIEIKSLGHVRVTGVMKKNNLTDTVFKGQGTIQLFDAQKRIAIDEGIGHFRFNVFGSPLFQGEVSIDSGKYVTIIPIPKDVSYGKKARIAIYAWNDKTDGAGYTENVMISGIDTTVKKDTLGPTMSIYLDDYMFHSGDVVRSNPTLIVRLSDSSGINTSTVGVGHQLSATINNPEQTFDISNYYHTDINNYQSGEARYPLRSLSDGKYTLRVKAWDIQNNSSETEIFFEVHDAGDLAMLNVVNYPNPFSNSTTFTFQRNTTDPIDVEVKIYSIAGRLIGNFNVQSITSRFVRIPWDGKDNEGASLANGIYFYKLIAHSQNGSQTSEIIGKAAIMR